MAEQNFGEWGRIVDAHLAEVGPEGFEGTKETVSEDLDNIEPKVKSLIASLGPSDGLKVLVSFLNARVLGGTGVPELDLKLQIVRGDQLAKTDKDKP